jgi:hypothetical protein
VTLEAWRAADQDALRWLMQVATDDDETGYDVGPMPDKAFVLHPLFERLDGKPIDDGRTAILHDGSEVWLPAGTGPEPPTRRVRWDDYADRRNVPMLHPGGWPGFSAALPGIDEDDYVSMPDEGEIGDPGTRRALFDVLLEHSDGGPETTCTAYFYGLPLADPRSGVTPPHVLRGPLGAYEQLYAGPTYWSPQNLWPDDHRWALVTNWNGWATAVSGPTALVEDLIAAPGLEAIRLPHLG